MKYFYPYPPIPKISKETINSPRYRSAYRYCRMNSCELRKQSAKWMKMLSIAIKNRMEKPLHPELQRIVQCDNRELKEHFESLFKPGMAWNNHGEWEIDHVIPQAAAETRYQLSRLFRRHNLQPLWLAENMKKHVTLPDDTLHKRRRKIDFASHYIKQQMLSVLPYLPNAENDKNNVSHYIKQQIFSVLPYM